MVFRWTCKTEVVEEIMKLIYKPPDSVTGPSTRRALNACLVGYAEPAGPYGWLDYAHWMR